MDLFDRKLTTDEALHLDSLIDTGGYDPYLLLVSTMMKDPEYLPSRQQTDKIMNHISAQDAPKTVHNAPETVHDTPETVHDTPENKNLPSKYIKLPDATIQRRKHKSKQTKTKIHNESTK